jgi:hypothetical protein
MISLMGTLINVLTWRVGSTPLGPMHIKILAMPTSAWPVKTSRPKVLTLFVCMNISMIKRVIIPFPFLHIDLLGGYARSMKDSLSLELKQMNEHES